MAAAVEMRVEVVVKQLEAVELGVEVADRIQALFVWADAMQCDELQRLELELGFEVRELGQKLKL